MPNIEPIPLPIANGFYLSDSLPVSAQECVGFYPNISQAASLSKAQLFGTPGTEQKVTTGEVLQVNRGAKTLGEKPYFVNGTSLYRVNQVFDSEDNESFTYDNLGTIAGTGRVSMDENGTQLMILVPGGKGYIFTESPDTLTEIMDTDFTTTNGKPQHVVFVDGYFVVTTDSNKFKISALRDGLTWNALDFGTAESDPDRVVAPFVYKNQLFIAGTVTCEGFNNIGGADFPFKRSGLFLDKGVSAPFSIVNSHNSVMFVGGGESESPAIWQLQGNTVKKVSTTAVDSLLGRLTPAGLGAVFSYSYAETGAYFVAFALPYTTLVYDSVAGLWHERKSQITLPNSSVVTMRSRVNSLVSAYNRRFVGDSQDGRIGVMDKTVYTEYGHIIFRRFATQPFQNNMKSLFVPSLELTVESGVGNSAEPDPQVRLERSKDGKIYFDDRSRSMGRIGETNRRAIWRRNGRVSRFEVFRFTITAPVKAVVIQLTARIAGGSK